MDDRVAVTDDDGDFHMLTADGQLIYTLSRDPSVSHLNPGDPQPGRFGKALGVTFDNYGHVILGDAEGGYLHVHSVQDPKQRWLVGNGWGEGLGCLVRAGGIAVTADGHILVCDKGNSRVQLFTVEKRTGKQNST